MATQVQRSAPSLPSPSPPTADLVDESTSSSLSRMVQTKQELLETGVLSASARTQAEKELRRARAAAKILAANEKTINARLEAAREVAAGKLKADEKRLEKSVSNHKPPYIRIVVACSMTTTRKPHTRGHTGLHGSTQSLHDRIYLIPRSPFGACSRSA